MNMICRKWWMAVVLNRNYDHEQQYKNISDIMMQEHINNKCADYKMLSDDQLSGMKNRENKVDVADEALEDRVNKAREEFETAAKAASDKKNGFSGGAASYRKAATGNYCFTQLHVILNRRGEVNMGDYIHSGCLDPTQPVINSTTKIEPQGQVSFAQKGMTEVLRDIQARDHMNNQRILTPLI